MTDDEHEEYLKALALQKARAEGTFRPPLPKPKSS
jgi:hypothetical protein